MWVVIPALALALGACAPSTAVEVTADSLSPAVRAAVDSAWHDERHAELVYQGILDDFGQVMPFGNVIYAEQRHASQLAAILAARGLAVPADRWTRQNVPRFATVREACRAAATAEIENIALYDRLLAGALPQDVRRVFEANRAASMTRHLPAFERCQ